MTTAFRLILFFAVIIFQLECFAQISKVQTIEGIQILGMKKLHDGALILSTESSKRKLECTKISIEGETKWNTSIEIPKLRGYNFNKLAVIEGVNFLFVVSQLEHHTLISKIANTNGSLVYENTSYQMENYTEMGKWIVIEDKISLLKTSSGKLLNYQLETATSQTIGALPSNYENDHYLVNFIRNNTAYTTSYKLERNHGKIHLYLAKYDAETGSTQENRQDLTLDHTCFTYNSSFDKMVFGVKQDETGFYLIGKLDIQFKKDYPTVKHGDNFIGFWIAKFNFNLELEYFTEMPFQFFNGIVPADVIQKPAVVDFKEDYNTELLVNINELKGVIYGNKYFIYLDSLGIHRYAIGGKDDYNFMEYDNLGLRNSGRNLRVRMMNDDWSAYTTNSIPHLEIRNDYSYPLRQTISIAKSSKQTNQDKAYNYLFFDKQILYFEYLNKKKGLLNIYK